MTFDITQNEKTMLATIRDLRPYETVTIQKDANGKPDYFIIQREQKVFLNEITNKVLKTA